MKTCYKLIFIVLLCNSSGQLYAQDPSAISEFESTTQGILIPRMLESERLAIAMPATGLLVYQTDNSAGFYFNFGNALSPNWRLLGEDADADPTNEIQTWSTLGGIPSGFSDNVDDVNDGDSDPTNEIELPAGGITGQVLTKDGTSSIWQDVQASEIVDIDGDTKIEANDQTGSKDYISMQINGQEVGRFLSPASNILRMTTPTSSSLYFGNNAGLSDTFSTQNIGIGNNALSSLDPTGGSPSVASKFNVAIGTSAGFKLSRGFRNSLIGYRSGVLLTTGNFNVMIGGNAGSQIETGGGNTILGHYSFLTPEGSHNVYLGADAGTMGAIPQTSRTGSVFIGPSAQTNDTSDHLLVIDHYLSSEPLLFGKFTDQYLQVGGELNIAGEYSFPITDGTLGQILSTDGSGAVHWITPVDNVIDADSDPTNEIELPTGGSNGQILQTDGVGIVSWVDAPAPVLIPNLGIGTTNPQSEVHIQGTDSHNQLILEPTGGTNDTSSIFLSEASSGQHGAILMYDGVENQFQIQGKLNGNITGTHFQLDRTNGSAGFGALATGNKINVEGDARISDYTQLGSDAPKIKMKKLVGTTQPGVGDIAFISHGIADHTKILGLDVRIETAGGLLIFPHGNGTSNQFDKYLDSSFVYINPGPSATNLVSRPYTILLTYEE